MTGYNMKIVNRLGPNKNGCYPFSEENINNIPDMNIFIEEEKNIKIKNACKDVLRRSMSSRNKYRYGEVGILLSIVNDDIYEVFYGNYHHVDMTEYVYENIVNKRQTRDLIFIHNHPNNSSFSYADVNSLMTISSLYGIIAVGNRHNAFVLMKEDRYKIDDYTKFIVVHSEKIAKIDGYKHSKDYYLAETNRYLLSNKTKELGLDYIKFRRKSK